MKNDIKKKKVLHVIHIVYDILSALFILFTSTVLIIYGATRSDEKTQDILTPNVQEVKQRRNYGYTDEYGIQAYMYSSDFLSNSNILAFITEYSAQVSSSFAYDNYNTYTINMTTNGKIYRLGSGASVENGMLLYSNISLKIAKTNGAQGIEDFVENVYTLQLINVLGPTILIEYQYYVSVPAHGSSGLDLGPQVIRTNINYNLNDWWCYRENNMDSGNTPFIDYLIFPKLDETIQSNNGAYYRGYNEGYLIGEQNGYNTGYEDGKVNGNQSGYTNGYNTGYNEGLVAGAQGIESNAFTVIGQAFDAVGNIFSIEVLPGLPMWILAFAPLIIAVIIVVIKMIKG